MDYHIEALYEENEKFETFLNTKIKEFNNVHSFHHKEIRKEGGIQPINIIVSDENKQWIGGISADVIVVWSWMKIHDFWISEDYRGRGIGGQLLDMVEKVAKEKGATKAMLTTFEFQARSFYELKGYHVAGEVKDYPPGSSYYTMVKTLV